MNPSPDELEHVHDGRGVAEGEAHLRLEPLGLGQFVGSPNVLVVVADRLLHQAVLARFQGGEDQLLVISPGHDVDDVDVAPGEDLLGVGFHVGDAELPGPGLGHLPVQVADGHQIAQGRAEEPG